MSAESNLPAIVVDSPPDRWYTVSRGSEVLGVVSAEYQGDVVSAARQYWPQYVGQMLIEENEPGEVYAVTRIVKLKLKNPYKKRQAIIVGQEPKRWWWADYIGPELIDCKRYELLCFVAANNQYDAMSAVTERWPGFTGWIELSEIVTMRQEMTERWQMGAFELI